MIVVSDTSPILNLECIGKLELLPAIYGEVVILRAVFDELSRGGFDFDRATWLHRASANDSALIHVLEDVVDAGEAEAIVLAKELKADLILIDERIGRRLAQEHGLNITGLLGVLRTAKFRSLIPAVKPVLDELMTAARFRVDHQLYQEVLESLGEL